jgi:hypothetical protein
MHFSRLPAKQIDASPWVQERLKQQQEQVNLLISKIRDLESNYNIIKTERDHLALQLTPKVSQSNSHGSTEPSIEILVKELETSRKQLAEAMMQVKSHTICIKDLEKVSLSFLYLQVFTLSLFFMVF